MRFKYDLCRHKDNLLETAYEFSGYEVGKLIRQAKSLVLL